MLPSQPRGDSQASPTTLHMTGNIDYHSVRCPWKLTTINNTSKVNSSSNTSPANYTFLGALTNNLVSSPTRALLTSWSVIIPVATNGLLRGVPWCTYESNLALFGIPGELVLRQPPELSQCPASVPAQAEPALVLDASPPLNDMQQNI